MKRPSVTVYMTENELDEVRRFAECEGRAASNYLLQLHKEYKRKLESFKYDPGTFTSNDLIICRDGDSERSYIRMSKAEGHGAEVGDE